MNTTPLAILSTGFAPMEPSPFGATLAPESNTPLDGVRAMRSVTRLLDVVGTTMVKARMGGKPVRLPERAFVRVSRWYRQDSYSDSSGYTVEASDPARAEDVAAADFVAGCLKEAFPPNAGNYRAAGMREIAPGRAVYENSCYGIGD